MIFNEDWEEDDPDYVFDLETDWKHLRFCDIGGGEYKLTHRSLARFNTYYTVEIINFGRIGDPSILDIKKRDGFREFIVTKKRFEYLLKNKFIFI